MAASASGGFLPGSAAYRPHTRTFVLACKSTVYAFAVDRNGWLEHRYWGPTTSPDDPFAHLGFGNVPMPFDPKPAAPKRDDGAGGALSPRLAPGGAGGGASAALDQRTAALHDATQTAELLAPIVQAASESKGHERGGEVAGAAADVHRAWSAATHDRGGSLDARRMENAAWRLMKMREVNPGSVPRLEAALEKLLRQASLERAGEASASGAAAAADAREVSPPRAVGDAEATSPKGLRRSKGVRSASMEALSEWAQKSSAQLMRGDSIGPTELHGAPHVGRNTKLLEYSDLGTGDYRTPSFQVSYEDGSTISPVVYVRHRIVPGKPAMVSGLPAVRCEDDAEATTLIVTLADAVGGLELDLYYTAFRDFDVIARRVVARNVNVADETTSGTDVSTPDLNPGAPKGTIRLERLSSAMVDFHTDTQWLTHLSGSWASERHVVHRRCAEGSSAVESSRGTSSHQHNPFVVLSQGKTAATEDYGRAYGFCLVYSGNFRAAVNVTESGRARVNVGINPMTFSWDLEPSKEFESPECLCVASDDGMGPLSNTLHDLIRERLLPSPWKYRICPTLINTWEAMYFDVTHARIVELARHAADVGVDLLVLDDGWFLGRDDDTSSLGDWIVDRRKLPRGLDGLASDLAALKVNLGIWVEPEMISVNSSLYREHPDWAFSVPGRETSEGRNQLVLDLSRPEVRDRIVEAVSAVLDSAPITYVKWDANRHLADVFSRAFPARQQGEVYHRFTLGVYDVWRRLTARYPHVLWESCSGGGGRFDAGMLAFSPQIWTSDNTDALARVKIQWGTSLAYPVRTMGAHISEVPNHQTWRSTTLKTRFLVSISGSFGLELDLTRVSATEKADLRRLIALRRVIAPIVNAGRLHRLWDPFDRDSAAAAWMFVLDSDAPGGEGAVGFAGVGSAIDEEAGDGAAGAGTASTTAKRPQLALVLAFNLSKDKSYYLPRLRCRGLDDGRRYVVEELEPGTLRRNVGTGKLERDAARPVYQFGGGEPLLLSGRSLMRVGLPLRFEFNGDSVCFRLTATT